jgi:predicted nucleic acid-binding protein
MSVLVDTSVWVQHFRETNSSLAALLSLDLVLTHPMVLMEVACGTPPAPRSQTLGNLGLLRQSSQATMSEVLDFIEREKLYGQGCGLVDVTLLASTLITAGTRLWTLDRRLETLAQRFGVAYRTKVH